MKLYEVERPVIVDLFSKAGGAAMGYWYAGWQPLCVDVEPQPNCPFPFVQSEALAFVDGGGLRGAIAVHASPPCQAFSSMRNLVRARGYDREYPDLVGPVRERLIAWGGLYVIENVPGAPLDLPLVLCGSMFDPPMDVWRHRLFESNAELEPPMWPCRHKLYAPRYASKFNRKQKTDARVCGVYGASRRREEIELWPAAMEIDWMTPHELAQAIPPRFTAFIGAQLLEFARTWRRRLSWRPRPAVTAVTKAVTKFVRPGNRTASLRLCTRIGVVVKLAAGELARGPPASRAVEPKPGPKKRPALGVDAEARAASRTPKKEVSRCSLATILAVTKSPLRAGRRATSTATAT